MRKTIAFTMEEEVIRKLNDALKQQHLEHNKSRAIEHTIVKHLKRYEETGRWYE